MLSIISVSTWYSAIITLILFLFISYNRISFNEGPTHETSTLETLYGGQFTLSTQLIKLNPLVMPHRRSTTFCLETTSLISYNSPLFPTSYDSWFHLFIWRSSVANLYARQPIGLNTQISWALYSCICIFMTVSRLFLWRPLCILLFLYLSLPRCTQLILLFTSSVSNGR